MSDSRRPIGGIPADETVLNPTDAAGDGQPSLDALQFIPAFERDATDDSAAGSHPHDAAAGGDTLPDWSALALNDTHPNFSASNDTHRGAPSDDLSPNHLDLAGDGPDLTHSADPAIAFGHTDPAESHWSGGSADIDHGPAGPEIAALPPSASPPDAPASAEHATANSDTQVHIHGLDSFTPAAVPETTAPVAPVDPQVWIAATSGGPPENLILHGEDDGTGTGSATNVGTLFTPDSANNPTTPSELPAIHLISLDTQDNLYFLASTASDLSSQIVKGSLTSALTNPTATPSYTTIFSGASAITGMVIDPDNSAVYFTTGETLEKVSYAGTATVLDNESSNGIPMDGLALDLPHDVAYFTTSETFSTSTSHGAPETTISRNAIYKTSNLTPSSGANSVTSSLLINVPVADGVVANGTGEGGITVDAATGLVYFATQKVSYDPLNNGHFVFSSSGIYVLNPTTLTITAVWTQGTGSGGPTGDLSSLVVDHATGEYFVSAHLPGVEGGAVYVGKLTANGTTAPTLFETIPTYTSGTVEPDPNGISVDNAPTLSSVTGTSTQAVQGGSTVALLSAVGTIADTDNDKSDGATIQITTNAQTGDELSVNGQQSGTLDGGKVTVTWNSSTHTITLFGTDSFAEYQTLLGQVGFQDTGTDNTTGSHPTRTISWSVSDGLLSSPALGTTLTIDRNPNVATHHVNVVEGASTGTVSAGDSDPDGDGLTVTAVTGGSVGSAKAGTYGSLTVNSNDTYSYSASNTGAIDGATTGSHPVDSFTYTVSDNVGGTALETLSFTIDRNPTVATHNVGVLEGASTGTVGASDTDPDGDSISVTAVTGGSVGSSKTGTYGSVTVNSNDTYSYAASNTAAINAAATGSHPTDTFTYTVSDGLGGTTLETLSFAIDRDPIQTTHNVGVLEGGSTGTVSAGDTDPDGDSLTVTAVTGGSVGSAKTGTYGSFTINSNDTYSYSASNTAAIDAAATGSHPTDTFTYTVSDGNGGTTLETLSFAVDRDPTQATHNVTLLEGASTGTVSAGDTDPDGDSLTVTALTGGSVGSAKTGTYGSFTINSNDTYSYSASNTAAIDAAATGSHPTDTFTYTVSDGNGGTTLETLSFAIDRDPTQATHTVSLLEGGSTGTVSAGDSDLDGDSLTVTAVTGGSVGSAKTGTYGSLTINSDDTYSYTASNTAAIDVAPSGSHPTDTFTYTISDGNGGTTLETLSFAVDRDPTQATHNIGLLESGSTGTVSAGDSDLDGDSLTVTAVTGGSVGSAKTGTYGSLTINSDDTYSYTASNTAAIDVTPSGSHPTDTFTYTVSDGNGGTTLETLSFAVDRDPTQATHNIGLLEGASTGTVSAGDADPDGDSLTVTAVTGGSVGSALTGTYGSFTIDSDDTYSYTASNTAAIDAAPSGSHPTDSFTYTVSDGNGGTTLETLTFTIDRDPTQATHNVNLLEGASTGTVSAGDSDPDGDSVTVTALTGGTVGSAKTGTYGSLTIDSDGTYSYTANNTAAIDSAPTGSHPTDSFTYTVSDGNGGTTLETLSFAIDRAPVGTADTVTVFAGATDTVATGAGVVSNDIDKDGDTLTVNTVNGSAGNVGTSIAGTYGHLTLNSDGGYTYSADNAAAISGAADDATLTDSFTYTASDGNGGTTADTTLTVTIDQAPIVTGFSAVATSGADFTTAHTVTFTLATGKDVDVAAGTTLALSDGGTATYVSGTGTESIVFTESAIVAPSDTLQVTGIGAGSIADAAGNPLAIAGTTVSSYTDTVSDTAAHLSAHIDSLEAAIANIDTVTDSDSGALSITQAQFTADAAFLDKIVGAYDVIVTDATGTSPETGASGTAPPYSSLEDVYDASHTLTQTIYFNDDGTQTVTGMGATQTVDDSASTQNDFIDLSNSTTATATGGSGNDGFYFGAAFNATDTVDGGAGTNNQIGLDGDYAGGVTLDGTHLSNVQVIALLPGFDYDLTAAANLLGAAQSMTIWATDLAAGNTVHFDGAAVTSGGSFTLIGGAGDDTLIGGAGNDKIYGLGGADTLTGNGGVDTFAYSKPADSTGTGHDTITDFDALTDQLQFTHAVAAIDTPIASGMLDTGATFDTELALAVNATNLAAHDAVLFTPNTGNLAGHTFLVVDANGTPGYQAGADYVIDITGATNLNSLSTSHFIA